MIYPWQQSAWQSILEQNIKGALAHGLLFSGPEGTGKQHFAYELACALLCSAPDVGGVACGQCSSCHLFRVGNHPDFIMTQPEEPGKAVVVDQIRALTQFLQLRTHLGGKKIALIFHADAMNTASANSLLKSLEEPPENCMIILVTNHPAKLLATVRSRCQQRAFAVPSTDIAVTWLRQQIPSNQDSALLLALASGAPLLAKQFAELNICDARESFLSDLESLRNNPSGVVKTADSWIKKDKLKSSLFWLTSFAIDLLRCKTSDATALISNTDLQARLRVIAESCDANRLAMFGRNLFLAKKQLNGNANAELLMTDLLIQWTELA